MINLQHTYSTRPNHVLRAIEAKKEWIEKSLGISLSEAACLETDLSFCEAAIPKLLAYVDPKAPVSTPIARLIARIQTFVLPPHSVPIVRLNRERAIELEIDQIASRNNKALAYSMDHVDGPILLQVQGLPVPVVALCVRYHEGPDSSSETLQDVVVMSREGVEAFVTLLKALNAPDGKARLHNGHRSQVIKAGGWDQLVLDPSIISLLRDDIDSFFKREAWFRKMCLPYKRGYLLHGSPGNGKTSAIKTLMVSHNLDAYTMRFFDEQADDGDLEQLFSEAADEAPAIVLLEDIDRVFPRGGESKSKLSLQQLLNCLDGVASESGVITIATANDPTALDPAILKRPGRFDRVISFPNPTPELRHRYFRQMIPSLRNVNIDEAVDESAGLSYAQLREAFIMAAQVTFESNNDIELGDLLKSIWSLRGSTMFGSMKASAGFAASPAKGGRV